MKTIKQTYEIFAPIEAVWDALVNPKTIELWGAGPAEMSDQEGKEFKLWGGDIYGENIEVKKNNKLVQEWYGGDWEEPSIATFTLTSKGDKTQVELVNENVPNEEADDIDDGWKKYYLGEIKKLLEG